jgi:hypothetical protein
VLAVNRWLFTDDAGLAFLLAGGIAFGAGVALGRRFTPLVLLAELVYVIAVNKHYNNLPPAFDQPTLVLIWTALHLSVALGLFWLATLFHKASHRP